MKVRTCGTGRTKGNPTVMDVPETKTCRKCGLPKPTKEFGRCSAVKDGLLAQCRACRSVANAAWRESNANELRTYEKDRYAAQKGFLAQKQRTWRAAHKEHRNEGLRVRYAEDVGFRLGQLLRNRLYQAAGGRSRGASAVRDLGCTVEELRGHLASRFASGMTWENYGEWHIDHVRPLASFDLTDPAQCAQACHYTNLQPLWAAENLSKGARYDG